MSLVGTRPPTVDEWKQYEPYHRGRLAVKPGLTGMWQVSGRSDITDFEEVVKLDMEYVCTDSFHASVFSIIFHTKLYIFNRRDQHANQNSRFTSLLRQCGIQKDKVIYKKNLEDSSIDWECVDKYIEKEREEMDDLFTCSFCFAVCQQR